MKRLFSYMIFVFMFVLPTLVFGDDWFVRPSGGKYGVEDGTSYNNAWDGFSKITWGFSGVKAGDTLYVCGPFSGEKLSIGASGSDDSNRITIRGDYAGDAGTIDANGAQSVCIFIDTQDFITVKNITVTGATDSASYGLRINSSTANYNTFDNVTSHSNRFGGGLKGTGLIVQDCTIYNNTAYGLIVTSSTNARVSRCSFYSNGTVGENHDGLFIGNGSTGFSVEDCISYNSPTDKGSGFDSSGSPTNGDAQGVYRRCLSRNNSGFGFSCSGENKANDNIRYEYCAAYDNKTNFHVYETVTAALYNCMMGDATLAAVLLWHDSGDKDVTISNCIAAGTFPYYVRINVNYTNLTASHNCIYGASTAIARWESTTSDKTWSQWQGLGYDVTESINQDPLFLDANSNNYNLAAGSPCIDAGVNIFGVHPATDIIGSVTPLGSAPDVGAYESGGLQPPTAFRILTVQR